MRHIALVPLLFAVAACDVSVPQATRPADVAMTPFTWKANTPIATRAYDINECELAGRGLGIGATETEIAMASAETDPAQVAASVRRCLENRGYTVTEKPVCTNADYSRGSFVRRPDILPPLESIICVDPDAGGFVTTVSV